MTGAEREANSGAWPQPPTSSPKRKPPRIRRLEAVVVRFAGDSGDGMQLTGGQFTLSTALAGNDLATFPDFPAEIRAPQGTTFGVSAFQINFGSPRSTPPATRPTCWSR